MSAFEVQTTFRIRVLFFSNRSLVLQVNWCAFCRLPRINRSPVQPRSHARPSACHLSSAWARRRLSRAAWWRNRTASAIWAHTELFSLCAQWQGGDPAAEPHFSPRFPKTGISRPSLRPTVVQSPSFLGHKENFRCSALNSLPRWCQIWLPPAFQFQALPFKGTPSAS